MYNGSIPLKDTYDIYIPHLTAIINDSFEKGYFPNVLKLAEVKPVFKKKDFLDKENHQPVSVLLHVSKVFEKTVHEQINSCMEPRFSMEPWNLIYSVVLERIITPNIHYSKYFKNGNCF